MHLGAQVTLGQNHSPSNTETRLQYLILIPLAWLCMWSVQQDVTAEEHSRFAN